jgi:hypothetical protein
MKLKLSDWASVAEIASGIAVVLTLVILILSVNKNTAVTQASMFAGLVEDLNDIYYTVVPDPELRRIWSQYIGGSRSALSDDDIATLVPLIVSRENLLDSALTMRNSGLIADNEWVRIAQLICREHARAVEIGLGEIIQTVSTEDFRDYVAAGCPAG